MIIKIVDMIKVVKGKWSNFFRHCTQRVTHVTQAHKSSIHACPGSRFDLIITNPNTTSEEEKES